MAVKGGCGKSLCCFTIINYLVKRGQKVHLLELDADNSDVARAWEGEALVTSEIIRLRKDGDWDSLCDLIFMLKDRFIAINMPASQKESIMTLMGDSLNDACQDEERGFNFFTFWPMILQTDDYDDFAEYIQIVPKSYIFPVLNEMNGDKADNFPFMTEEKYDDVRDEVMKRGQILKLFRLPAAVAEAIRTKGHPEDERVGLIRTQLYKWSKWEEKMDKILNPILGDLIVDKDKK